MNYINYLKHILYTPETYLRRFDFDLEAVQHQSKRIALVAMPFIGMYGPAGTLLSLSSSGTRAIAHLSQAYSHQDKKEWAQCAKEIGSTAIAVSSLAATLFNSNVGLFVSTASDTFQAAAEAIEKLKEGKYDKAVEEGLQALSSLAYLGFMATGSLELIFCSTLIQAFICFMQAREEYAKEGHYLEAGAKIILGTLRLRQTAQYAFQIQRRNELLQLEKYSDLMERALKGKAARHLIESPISDLNGSIESHSVLLESQEGEYDFGAYFHGFGKELVKGANISLKKVVVDGKECIQAEFKVNHAYRDQLDEMDKVVSSAGSSKGQEILKLAGSHIESVGFNYTYDEGELNTREIELEGLGTIRYGIDPIFPNEYDRVVVQMDSNKTIYDLHEILAFTNLDAALCLSNAADIDRLKIGHLFRIFFPREATPFERTEEYFKLSIEELKKKMFEMAPQMEQVYSDYFDKITEAEIISGKIRYRVQGLAAQVYQAGGRALTSAVTGAYFSDDELFGRIASMLELGMIAREMRIGANLDAHGLGGIDDMTGGSDSVYTQMITEKDIQKATAFSSYYYSKARFLISLNALELGSYQYLDDHFGMRLMENSPTFFTFFGFFFKHFRGQYEERLNILEFTKALQENREMHDGHEVMLKERIDPSYFTGIILDSEKTKKGLLDYLRAHGLLERNDRGQETVLNKPVDQFFLVGDAITESMIEST